MIGQFKHQLALPTIPRLHLNRRRWGQRALLAGLVLVTAVTLPTLIPSDFKLNEAVDTLSRILKLMVFAPQSGVEGVLPLVMGLMQSLGLAVLTTIIGTLLALGLSLFASRQLMPAVVTSTVQAVMAVIRAVPTIIWVLIYSIVFGLGTNAAVVGLSFHSVAYLVKVYADSIDDLKPHTLEALRANGAGWLAVVTQAVLPSCWRQLVSWSFIRFEINFADAIAIVAAAGAGGLGYQLFMASGFYFDFHEVGLIIDLILVVAVLMEATSYWLRQHLTHKER